MASKTIRNLIIFLLFFALGIFGCFYFSDYFLEKEKNPGTDVNVDNSIDITEDEGSQELINNLLKLLNNDPMFYSTKGVVASSMDNNSRLILVYNYILNNNLSVTEEQLNVDYVGGTLCLNTFAVSSGVDGVVGTTCFVKKISKDLFTEINKKMFNDSLIDTSVGFVVDESTSCIVNENNYVCGNTSQIIVDNGKLESKFEIIKVIKNEDGSISIYQKGYLNDKRTGVNDPYDQYDNYYLHSSDSTNYYYELKSADNLTFVHHFKTNDRQNYYYVNTELVKE